MSKKICGLAHNCQTKKRTFFILSYLKIEHASRLLILDQLIMSPAPFVEVCGAARLSTHLESIIVLSFIIVLVVSVCQKEVRTGRCNALVELVRKIWDHVGAAILKCSTTGGATFFTATTAVVVEIRTIRY